MDIEQFRYDPLTANQLSAGGNETAEPSKRAGYPPLPEPGDGLFIRGPIPLNWLQEAILHGRKALNVGLALWYAAGFKRENPVRLTRQKLKLFDVTPKSARQILRRFETAGLVQVDRSRGRGPIVCILDLLKG